MSSSFGLSVTEDTSGLGVELCEISDSFGHVIIVRDVESRHCVIRFHPHREEQTIGVSVAAEWSDKHPGNLANYTPRYEDQSSEFAIGELTMSDEGVLRAWARVDTATHVEMYRGWALQLPPSFVEPVRRAIIQAEAAISPLAGVRPSVLRKATDDELAGMRWWNGLPVSDRAHWLAEAGSAVVAEAWEAFKRARR